MGLVVLLTAATSRAPKTLRVLGAVMCLQGLASTLMGPEHARAIMEWETMRGTSVLRVGAAVALAAGVSRGVRADRPPRSSDYPPEVSGTDVRDPRGVESQ